MDAPRKNTGRTLIVNGDFSDFYTVGWTVHVGTVNQEGEGSLNYLYIRNGIIKQAFALPVEPGAGKGRYELRFDYQPPQEQPADPIHPYFELWAFPSESFDEKKELVGASRAKTTSMEWLPRVIDYDLFRPGDSSFEVRFASGNNPETGSSDTPDADAEARASGRVEWPSIPGALHLTHVVVRLHLPDLELEQCRITLNGQEGRLLPNGRYPICRGAEHRLEMMPTSACAWAGSGPYPGTSAYADWENAGEADRLGITLTALEPESDGAQHIAKPWKITCENRDDGEPVIRVESIYDAEPYSIPVSLGHYKLKIGEVREASVYPVVEYQESVEMAIQVLSAITDTPAANAEVVWRLPDGTTATTTANAEGWATYAFQPKAGGEHTITAEIESPYDGAKETRSLKVQAYALSPWKDQIKVQFDEFAAAFWAEGNVVYPCRGGTHTLKLAPDAGSLLVGGKVKLAWGAGDSAADLDVRVSPALDSEQPLNETGATWTLTCGDVKDGEFTLLVTHASLLKGLEMSVCLAHNKLEISEVREVGSPVVDEGESETLAVRVISAFTRDALSGIQVTWRLPDGTETNATTGADGWAEYEFHPDVAGLHRVTAEVTNRYDGDKEDKVVEVTALATSPWRSEVKVQFDEFPPAYWTASTTGYPCRGRTHVIKLVPNTGSSLIGSKVKLVWGEGDSAVDLGVSVSPALGSEHTLTTAGISWTLTCGNLKNGAFTLLLSSTALTKPLALSMSLAHNNFEITNTYEGGVGGPVWNREWGVKLNSVYGAKEPVAGVECQFPTDKTSRTEASGWAYRVISLLNAPYPRVVSVVVPYTGQVLTVTPD